MQFHILTLFPEVLSPYFSASILGRAQKTGVIQIHLHQLRNYAHNKHNSVDDRPYGGGPGMLLRPEVVVEAVEDLKKKFPIDRVFLTSPRGRVLTQSMAQEVATLSSILLICGRYEGVDQRAIDLVVDEEISIGDYVLTGGELASAVIVDAIARLIPKVVGDEEGPQQDSHSCGLLEQAQYTRPEIFRDLSVPPVLLSGDHAQIKAWKEEERQRTTQCQRPDLIKRLI